MGDVTEQVTYEGFIDGLRRQSQEIGQMMQEARDRAGSNAKALDKNVKTLTGFSVGQTIGPVEIYQIARKAALDVLREKAEQK